MSFIRNLLALIGLVAVIAAAICYPKMSSMINQFDPGAIGIYKEFANKMVETMDPADAMVYSVKVEDGITPEDVKESMKSLAVERNFLSVGESPFYKQYEAVTGEDYRHVTFMSFCDVRVGAMMLEYNSKYTAFMPCRMAIVEEPNGELWIHAMSLDMMIYGGKSLPPELKSEAERVWGVIKEIMEGAAKGEF